MIPMKSPDALLRLREWDSDHFGFPVADVASSVILIGDLAKVLCDARRMGVQLVYWQASSGCLVPENLLREYSGSLVDQKVTYLRENLSNCLEVETERVDLCQIAEYPRGFASDDLLALAVIAGLYSRFRTDSRIPVERYKALYETWMQKSTQHELADAVLVATQEGDRKVAGMVTLCATGGNASIGLIAVHPDCQRLGVGSALMRGAHRWMTKHAAERATVVTQAANRPACRLYERFGYHCHELVDYYHFWPLAED